MARLMPHEIAPRFHGPFQRAIAKCVGAFALALLLAGCTAESPAPVAAPDSPPRTIDWLELMPPEDIAVLEAVGEVDHSGTGPAEVVTSGRPVLVMNGAKGKLAGYVVPVGFDDEGRITEFFLVPYFGACIHLPPPPPNQIVHVRTSEPLPAGRIWDAYWAIGTLRVADTQHELAQSVYSMDLDELQLMSRRYPETAAGVCGRHRAAAGFGCRSHPML